MNFFFFSLLAIINGLKGAVPSSNVVSGFVNLIDMVCSAGGFFCGSQNNNRMLLTGFSSVRIHRDIIFCQNSTSYTFI
jgi:hypothetical protein